MVTHVSLFMFALKNQPAEKNKVHVYAWNNSCHKTVKNRYKIINL